MGPSITIPLLFLLCLSGSFVNLVLSRDIQRPSASLRSVRSVDTEETFQDERHILQPEGRRSLDMEETFQDKRRVLLPPRPSGRRSVDMEETFQDKRRVLSPPLGRRSVDMEETFQDKRRVLKPPPSGK